MDYLRIYNALMERAKDRPTKGRNGKNGYEYHHIVPRSFGGTDESFNIVSLTYKEHWLAHLLLVKIADTPEKRYKAHQAILMMGRILEKRCGKMYEVSRRNISNYVSTKHKGTLIVKDATTGIMIGRVSKTHPKVLSGEWVFFHTGMTRSETYKVQKKIANSGASNANSIDISNEAILEYCHEFYNLTGVVSYKLVQVYVMLRYGVKIPRIHNKSKYRQCLYGNALRVTLNERYGIRPECIPRYGTPYLNELTKKLSEGVKIWE